MRISHQHRFIFLAVPRTGSTAMRRVLDPFSDIRSVHRSRTTLDFPFYHHISARELKTIFHQREWDWSSYRKFCVVRNPFDRIVSLYHHRLTPPAKRDRHCSQLHRLRSWLAWQFFSPSSFRDFVESIDPIERLTTSLDFFAFDAAGKPLVDDILRYERLSDGAPAYLRLLGLPAADIAIPRLNRSPSRRSYHEYYDEYSRHRVALLYRFETAYFGYEYDNRHAQT